MASAARPARNSRVELRSPSRLRSCRRRDAWVQARGCADAGGREGSRSLHLTPPHLLAWPLLGSSPSSSPHSHLLHQKLPPPPSPPETPPLLSLATGPRGSGAHKLLSSRSRAAATPWFGGEAANDERPPDLDARTAGSARSKLHGERQRKRARGDAAGELSCRRWGRRRGTVDVGDRRENERRVDELSLPTSPISTVPRRHPQHLQLSSPAVSPLARLRCHSPWSLLRALPTVLASKSGGHSSFAASPPNHGVAAAPDLPLRSLWAPDPRGPVAGERRGGVSGGEGGGGYDKKRRKASPRQVSGGEDGCAAMKMATSRAEAKRANEGEERDPSRPPASAHPCACTRTSRHLHERSLDGERSSTRTFLAGLTAEAVLHAWIQAPMTVQATRQPPLAPTHASHPPCMQVTKHARTSPCIQNIDQVD
uniref:Uncharacterized protein n=1 Tax=Oryza meridionalis TaxID=40149 RepID=A0A0E0C2F4_9ORYZ